MRWDWESDGVWDTSWSAVKTDTYQYSVEGTHTVSLEVKDTGGLTDKTTRQITVVPDEIPPVAVAGPNQTVDEGTLVTFDGSGSSDNIGIVNYTWTFTDGTAKILYGVSPTYTFDNVGIYEVTLTVRDAAGLTDTDVVMITVEEKAGTFILVLGAIIGIIIALIVALTVIMMMRKKQPPGRNPTDTLK